MASGKPAAETLLEAFIAKCVGVEHVVLSNSFGLAIVSASSDSATVDPATIERLGTLFATTFGVSAETFDHLGFGS
jgi:hypothetical protein